MRKLQKHVFAALISLSPIMAAMLLLAKTLGLITLDFDGIDTSVTGIASLSNEFQSQGVIFSEVDPVTGVTIPASVVADGLFGNGAFSLPNSVAFGFQFRSGIVRAIFIDPGTGSPAVTDFVSAQVGDKSGEPDPITMTAFGLNDEVLGTSSFTSLFSGHFGLVSISAPGIHRVEFSDADPSGADFDDFTYNPVSPTMLNVTVDIKPDGFPNTINPKSKGVIPVAILTTMTFNATTVDPLSVKFGPSGATEAHNKGHIEDADGDGDLDLVLHFKTKDTGINCRDTQASLTGKTYSGQDIAGSDVIQTVGCTAKTVAKEEAGIPEGYALLQNYPNPFNPETEIRFALPEANHVAVRIFNTLGEEIRMLVDEQREAGYHRVRWDGKDKNGHPVASGMYLYQLQAGSFSQVKKMSLLR